MSRHSDSRPTPVPPAVTTTTVAQAFRAAHYDPVAVREVALDGDEVAAAVTRRDRNALGRIVAVDTEHIGALAAPYQRIARHDTAHHAGTPGLEAENGDRLLDHMTDRYPARA